VNSFLQKSWKSLKAFPQMLLHDLEMLTNDLGNRASANSNPVTPSGLPNQPNHMLSAQPAIVLMSDSQRSEVNETSVRSEENQTPVRSRVIQIPAWGEVNQTAVWADENREPVWGEENRDPVPTEANRNPFLRVIERLLRLDLLRDAWETIIGHNDEGRLNSEIFFKSFLGLFQRDLRVLTREFHTFLLRVGMQPLLFLFVFTFILPRMGGANPMASGAGVDFGTIILPGLMAVAIMFSGIAAVALPLSSEFGITREIDDRVMCPLPLWAVALEKVCFSAIQSIIAALLVIPMAYYVPAVPVRAHVANWFLLVIVLILASLLAGSLGLVIGSTVNPKQIGLVFSIIVVPITFLGCVYYPWARLGTIPWVKYGVLFNPIVYMSEGLRAAVTPSVAHMPWWAILLALLFFTAALSRWGLRGFMGRVLS
jgi:ABC-2 type transport system permease protein